VLNQSNDGITEGELCAISEEAVTYIVYSSLTERQISDQIVKQLADEPLWKRRTAAFSYLVLI